jgi:3',5'-nucleoside bisphosphate phosphatase
MGVRADLHVHTNHSDGFLSPDELLHKAHTQNISILGVSDHDTVAGIAESIAIGIGLGIEVVPGVELSTMVGEREVHVLGYFIDCDNKHLLDYLSFFRQERLKRAERIVEKLNHIKVPLKIESVLERAAGGSIGRPHIASAMVDEGFIGEYHEAFDRFIGVGKPAYERKFQLSPLEAIKLISTSGGLSFLAHPGRYLTESAVTELIKCGLDGIEVVHPSHSPELTAHYKAVASEYFLLESGGSDFHGGKRNDDWAFGAFYVDDERVLAMKRRLFSAKSNS